ncbi:hypothetical protein [Winogradskya humida]|uniref:Uncharacterized protein n=1 Tax=Winogradskya humida TaxID=113566 RepID=A0ABQ4A664_9ACTN|nr:hypothetical protein [Actinoplanes humidus]GIE26340.1 hypothetical protein Ahu01nite_094420 [Actinoplanes humidus]
MTDDIEHDLSQQPAPLFASPETLEIPSAAERSGYKKKSGSSDTANQRDEIIT